MRPQKSLWVALLATFHKEYLSEARSRYFFFSLPAFTLTALAAVSLSTAGQSLGSALLAALYWLILFFSAMAGLGRSYMQEEDAGTMLTLRVFAEPLAVLYGKTLFNIALLAALSLLTTLLFLVFFGAAVSLLFLTATLLGSACLAAVSTLTAALAAAAEGRTALYTVLTFPLVLPAYLAAVSLTAGLLDGRTEGGLFLFLGSYLVVVLASGALLAEHL